MQVPLFPIFIILNYVMNIVSAALLCIFIIYEHDFCNIFIV